MQQADSSRRSRSRPRLLFVCKMNQCRSPLAALWAVRKCAYPEDSVRSVGVKAMEGLPAHPICSRFLLTHGLSTEHRSRQMRLEDCAWADRILCMEDGQCDLVRRCYPEHGHKVHNLASEVDKSLLEDPVEEAKDAAESARFMAQACTATENFCAALAGGGLKA